MPGSSSNFVTENHQYNEVELPASVEIKESKVCDGQPGAFCKILIKKDTRFGPYKGELINPGQKADIDYRYAWEVFEKRRNVLKFTISASDPKTSNWMRNVNCARFYEEQNILSSQEGFSIFYTAMKDIKDGEELLTWFDPKLLKRTKRRMSRGERRKVGYTIEVVPWSDEKKFVPEIIETKRARKKKVLGEDMLCFEQDAALMQKSMNSMFRIPRKVDFHPQLNKMNSQSQLNMKVRNVTDNMKGRNVTDNMKARNVTDNMKVRNVTESKKAEQTTLRHFPVEQKMETKSFIRPTSVLNISTPKTAVKNVSNVIDIKKEAGKVDQSSYHKTIYVKKENDGETKLRQDHVKSGRTNSVKSYIEKFKGDRKEKLELSTGFNPNDPNLLKPVVIRTKDNGVLEMEDHDEIYIISSLKVVRQECDDLCQCLDKRELLEQESITSSNLQKRDQDVIVRFSLLPEHQNFTVNNKVIYKCDICDSSYNHAFSLKRHYLGVHINHRYLSKDDILHCQLETFHSNTQSINYQVDEECEKTKNTLEHQNSAITCENNSEKIKDGISLSSNDFHKENDCRKELRNNHQDVSKSLICEETLMGSDLDDSKKEVPTLKSLAQSQVDAAKSSSISDGLSIQNTGAVGVSSECSKRLSEGIEKVSECSIPAVKNTPHDAFVESCNEDANENLKPMELELVTDSQSCSDINHGSRTEEKDSLKNCLSQDEQHTPEENEKVENMPNKGDVLGPMSEENDSLKKEDQTTEKVLSFTPEDDKAEKGQDNCVEKTEENDPEYTARMTEDDCVKSVGCEKLKEMKCNTVKSEKEDSSTEELSIPGNPKDTNEPLPTQDKQKISKSIDEYSNMGTASIPQPQLSVPTRLASASDLNIPPPQQQFLLILPITSPTSKLSPPTSNPILVTPSISSQSQNASGMPLVALSIQETLITTSVQLQSSLSQGKPLPLLSVSSSSVSSQNLDKISPTGINNINATTVSSLSDTTAASSSSQIMSHQLPSTSSMPENRSKPVEVKEADRPVDLYRCHMCVLVYKSMDELKYHIRNDPHRFKGGFKQYACLQCSVRFRNKANLARHNLMHHQADDKDRKFRCLTCGKAFTSETYLKMHARFHLGKSFPCKYGCVDAFFPNAGTLVKHLRAVHPGLNLKEYLKEKALKDRLKRFNTPNDGEEYSIDNPGVGFQAKRGRPKGSKNIPKEFKLFASPNTTAVSIQEDMPIIEEKSFVIEKRVSTKKYFPGEKSWHKRDFQFQFDRTLSTENIANTSSFSQRRFNCKLCSASFRSHLYLLKHRSRRHHASQSVQEFLFQMTNDEEDDLNHPEEEDLQFSPPPSPKLFFSNVNQRSAENMSKYIEGGAEMLKNRKKLSFDFEANDSFSPPKLEWAYYNFPPSFSYVRDCTSFYDSASKVVENMTQPICKQEIQDIDNGNTMTDLNNEASKESEDAEMLDEKPSKLDGSNGIEGSSEELDQICKDIMNEILLNVSKRIEEGCISPNRKEEIVGNSDYGFDDKDDMERNLPKPKEVDNTLTDNESSINREGSPLHHTGHGVLSKDSESVKDSCDANDSLIFDPEITPVRKADDGMKIFLETKIGMYDLMYRLNKLSLRALDLELGSRSFWPHSRSNDSTLLDSLNLFSKEGSEISCQKFSRKKRHRFSSVSACGQLLHSKKLHRHSDQLFGSDFNIHDLLRHEPRRYSIWQGQHYNKTDRKTFEKFCYPVVEFVRQQKVMKMRKEFQDRNEKEKIELKPEQRGKENFAKDLGLMSRRDYERSYHAQETTEHCIKPPEIWESYNRIWFGKKGMITVVCSICHRHFSCLELCLRHQLKKHPHIEPSSLAMERDNYVEDMFYYYPMPFGILAQSQLVPDNMVPPEVYACSRCKFPFKNMNKLHSHMIQCDPNNDCPTSKHPSLNMEINKAVVENRTTDKNVRFDQTYVGKPIRQRMLTSKFKSYQMIKESPVITSKDLYSQNPEQKMILKSPVPAARGRPKSLMNFSSLPRRKRNQYGLLYNPSNHTRRRELYQVLDQHQCLGCSLKFKSMSMLERHVKTCSGKDKLKNQKPLLSGLADEMMIRKQHTCRYCNKRFTFIKGVDLHYKRVCSVRKIREEENQLTEEDLAHEAELEKIIEHLKWSKSFNTDSSDIIQGRVKVEEDGTLTRVDKKRGRPFGSGKSKRIKKKGFKWTTLKHHRQEDENDQESSSPEVVTSPQSKPSPSEDGKQDDWNEETNSNMMTKKFVEASGIYETSYQENPNGTSEMDSYQVTPKKRGRPFKNQNKNLSIISLKSTGKRGRPTKSQVVMKSQLQSTQQAQALKDSINFKRAEAVNKKFFDSERGKPPLLSKETLPATKTFSGTEGKERTHPKDSMSYQESGRSDESVKKEGMVSKKRSSDEPPVLEVIKLPARKRGRPKKFDPSDMESSYKKKKKSDPGYVPFIRSTSMEDSGNMDSNEQVSDQKHKESSEAIPGKENNAVKTSDDAFESKKPLKNSGQEKELKKQNLTSPDSQEKQSEFDRQKACKDTLTKKGVDSVDEKQYKQSYQVTETSPSSKTKSITNVNANSGRKFSPKKTDKSYQLGASKTSPVELKVDNSTKQKSPLGQSVEVKKRTILSTSPDSIDVKKAKFTVTIIDKKLSEDKETSPKKETVQPNPLSDKSSKNLCSKSLSPEGKPTPASQVQHCITAVSSTLPGVQTPVAVRIVALPMSSAQKLSSLSGMKVIRSPESCSLSLTSPTKNVSMSPTTSFATTVVSSPQKQLTVAQSSVLKKSPGTHSIILTTKTNPTATARIPTAQAQSILFTPGGCKSVSVTQPSTVPLAQVIPIENGKLLIPPQAIQTGVAPRFIIHSSNPMKSVPTTPQPKVIRNIPLSGGTNTLITHVPQSTVLLTSGKVVPVVGTATMPSGSSSSNMGQNLGLPQGKRMISGNMIRPPGSSFIPSGPILSNPPQSVIRKEKPADNPTEIPTLGGTAVPQPVYYVQTPSLKDSTESSTVTESTGTDDVQTQSFGNCNSVSLDII